MTSSAHISAIVPVSRRTGDVAALAGEYITALESIDSFFEIIFVVDGDKPSILESLEAFSEQDKRVRIIKFARAFGEATAISVGFRYSTGDVLLTLPAYHQIDPASIKMLVDALHRCDMAVAHRSPRASKSVFEVCRRRLFHWLIKVSSGHSYSDLGCTARAMKRGVLDEIPMYGEQDRFLPLLASRQGFRVTEVRVTQSPRDRFDRGYGPRFYLHRFLDIFSVVFLVRFTKKPLRFFGMIGSLTFLFGGAVLAYLIVQRLFFGVPLADRPALLVASLLTVLGLQIFSLGLLGELIIFTHARDMKEYTIEKIIN